MKDPETIRTHRNNLARECYARQTTQNTEFVAGDTESSHDHRNWLARKSRVLPTETTEHTEKRKAKRRKVNQHASNKARRKQYDNEWVSGTIQMPIFSTCCAKGKVYLPLLALTPPSLLALLTEILAFTSMGAKIDKRVVATSDIYTFHIHGEIYHQIGTLLPENQTNPSFCQIYMYDTDEQQRYRQCLMPDLDTTQMIQKNSVQDLKMKIIKLRDECQYTTPTASEVAVLM
ncbi:12728_t:CDS:2, partial [Acaulospora morrowiae]